MSELTGKVLPFKMLVVPMEADEKTKGGIILAESARKPQFKGQVALIGESITQTKVGDIIYYGQHAGTFVAIDDVNYLLLAENDCLYID